MSKITSFFDIPFDARGFKKLKSLLNLKIDTLNFRIPCKPETIAPSFMRNIRSEAPTWVST